MKRALTLIITLSLLTFSVGWHMDRLQQQTALKYLDALARIRELIREGAMAEAAFEEAYLHALWQQDAHWLNVLLDHHHTRNVEAALRRLATTLEGDDQLQALLAMDDVTEAFEEAAQRNMAVWENIM